MRLDGVASLCDTQMPRAICAARVCRRSATHVASAGVAPPELGSFCRRYVDDRVVGILFVVGEGSFDYCRRCFFFFFFAFFQGPLGIHLRRPWRLTFPFFSHKSPSNVVLIIYAYYRLAVSCYMLHC